MINLQNLHSTDKPLQDTILTLILILFLKVRYAIGEFCYAEISYK